MSAVMFAMHGSRVTAWQYFDLVKEAKKRLLGTSSGRFTHMYLLCKPPAGGYHGPYLIKETSSRNDEWEKLRTYVNTLTPEQLKELKI